MENGWRSETPAVAHIPFCVVYLTQKNWPGKTRFLPGLSLPQTIAKK